MDRDESGFTLIEMLVALAIFSLAALAILRLSGATASTTGILRDQALAQIVAQGLAAEAVTDPAPVTIGQESGRIDQGGRGLAWTGTAQASPEPRIQMLTFAVAAEGGPARAQLTVFKRTAAP